MTKKLVNFKLDPLVIEQLNKMAEGRTKVSVVEEALDIAYETWKHNKKSKPFKKESKYIKESEI